MIAGHDTVLITAVDPARMVQNFIEKWSARWPSMLIMVGDDSPSFTGWNDAVDLPPTEADVIFVRDKKMERFWHEKTYEYMDENEGPFGIFYEPCRVGKFSITMQSQPYNRSAGFGFLPYGAVAIGAGITLVTIVTPESEGPFFQEIIDGLMSSAQKSSAG